MPWQGWLVIGLAAWVFASIVAAPLAGKFIRFGDTTPDDSERRS